MKCIGEVAFSPHGVSFTVLGYVMELILSYYALLAFCRHEQNYEFWT